MFVHGSIFFEFINITLYKDKIHSGDLGEGHNVIRSVKEAISLYKNNRNTISLYKNNCNKDRHLYSSFKEKKRESSEILQNKPGGRMLLLLELDSVSSSVFLVTPILLGLIW